jgi:Ca2+/Na+ antiporter
VSSLRARLRAADPVTGLVALASFVVYLLHGFNGVLKRDLGVYLYGAQQFLDGVPPYEAIRNRAGPLAHVIPAVGIWFGRRVGADDVTAARFLYLLLSVACVCLVYLLARELYRSRLVGVVTATAFLGFQAFIWMATGGPREKTAMVLFLLAGLLCLRYRRWATVGVFTALGTLTWQPVFFALLVSAGVAIALAPSGRWVAALRYVVGGAVTTGVVLVYYALHGALGLFFQDFVLINARYTDAHHLGGDTWRILEFGYGASVWLVLLGLVAMPVVAGTAVRRAWRTREPVPVAMVAVGAGWLAGLLWTANSFDGYLDLFVLLPFAALGLGGLADPALRWIRARGGRTWAVAVAGALAIALTAFATVTSVSTRFHTLEAQRAAVAKILKRDPDGSILSIQAPQVLVLAHRRNPTPVQMFVNGFDRYVDDTWPGGLQGYAAWVQRTSPDLVVMQRDFRPAWLMPTLLQDYRRVGKGPTFEWWARKDARAKVTTG